MCLNIVDYLIDFTDFNVTVVDRACGKGNFLLAVIYRFVENGADIEYVANNIVYGYDISESQIDKCRRFIKLATGIEPKNIQVKDTLNMTVKKLFTYEVGNYPFNDSSEEVGRSTDKLKENTGDLDYKFYSSKKIAQKRAVIIRGACLAKNTNVRKEIFTDSTVHTIMNTSNYFNVKPQTMCVFSDNSVSVIQKDFIDINNNIWSTETDVDTKLSIGITSENKDLLFNILEVAKKSNFGNIWNRPNIKRSDKRVNNKKGLDFVQTTGFENKELIIEKFDGDENNFNNLNTWRIAVNTTATSEWKIGACKIIRPNLATSNSMVDFSFETFEEAKIQKKYIDSPYVKFIASMMHITPSNSSEFFSYVPYYKNLTEEKLEKLNESV